MGFEVCIGVCWQANLLKIKAVQENGLVGTKVGEKRVCFGNNNI